MSSASRWPGGALGTNDNIWVTSGPAGITVTPDTSTPPAAPVHEWPTSASYHGRTVSSDTPLDANAICNLTGGRLSCFDTRKEADASIAAVLQARSLTPAPLAAAALCSYPNGLELYENGNFNNPNSGFVLRYYDYGVQNLASNRRNEVSSYKTGGCGAYLYDLANGGNPHIGGPANTNVGVMPFGWNDRIDSIQRV